LSLLKKPLSPEKVTWYVKTAPETIAKTQKNANSLPSRRIAGCRLWGRNAGVAAARVRGVGSGVGSVDASGRSKAAGRVVPVLLLSGMDATDFVAPSLVRDAFGASGEAGVSTPFFVTAFIVLRFALEGEAFFFSLDVGAAAWEAVFLVDVFFCFGLAEESGVMKLIYLLDYSQIARRGQRYSRCW